RKGGLTHRLIKCMCWPERLACLSRSFLILRLDWVPTYDAAFQFDQQRALIKEQIAYCKEQRARNKEQGTKSKTNRATAFKNMNDSSSLRARAFASEKERSNLLWSKIASTRTTQHSFAMTTSFKCGCPGKTKPSLHRN